MHTLKVKKLRPDAVVPSKAHPSDAGFDLTLIRLVKHHYDFSFNVTASFYGTGIAVEIPEGYVGVIVPRSSISKTTFSLANSVGIIDSSYRGELIVALRDNKSLTDAANAELPYKGFQLILIKLDEFNVEETEELSETARGEGGFGSTGK